MRALVLLSSLLVVGCGGGDEGKDATMTPGQDCLACHKDFSVGGTVYGSAGAQVNEGVEGVTVTIVDSAQKTLALTSNRAGNFYSTTPVTWPADVTFTLGTRSSNMVAAPSGACGSCHTSNGQNLVYLLP
jgi:hypothetical protein